MKDLTTEQRKVVENLYDTYKDEAKALYEEITKQANNCTLMEIVGEQHAKYVVASAYMHASMEKSFLLASLQGSMADAFRTALQVSFGLGVIVGRRIAEGK